jgi:hypothetical protein
MPDRPVWKIDQPPLEDMMSPVRCTHCCRVYDIGFVHVTARYQDCTVWTSPCCGHPGIDDRPWISDRHYRDITRGEAAHGDFYDVFGIRHRWS